MRALFAALLVAHAASAAKVTYATARTAFLDAGTRDGLAQGMEVRLRSGKSCRIQAISDRYASCSVDGAQPGDAFALPPAARAAPPPPRPALIAAAELKKQSALLASAALPLVEFHGTPQVRKAVAFEARAAHSTWAASTSRPWSQERVDAWARGAPLGKGFALYADVSARYFTARGDPVSARPDKRAQLYVWEAAVRRDAPGAAFAIGRLRPFFAPGVTPLDGAQLGFRSDRGDEVGVYGGAIPTAISLSPATDAGTAGAYWRVQSNGSVYFRHEARVAVITTPELGRRIEGEGVAQLSLGRSLDVAADLRGGAGDNGGLDAARFDLLARPLQKLSLTASFRYLGLRTPERDGPGTPLLGGASRHGDASAQWEAAEWLVVSARAGGDQDLTSSSSRGFVGPEISLPLLGISAGYQEERGFVRGRTAWLQGSMQRPSWLRLTATGSWSYTQQGGFDGDELGLTLGAAAELSRHWSLRVSALSRVGGRTGPLQSALAGGAAATADLFGQF